MKALLKQALDALEESVPDSAELVAQRVEAYGENFRPERLAAMRKTVSDGVAAIEALRAAIAQPESEPVAGMLGRKLSLGAPDASDLIYGWVPLYAAPVQPAYVLLTDEQIDAVTTKQWGSRAVMPACRAYARAIEKAVRGEK